MNPVQLLRHPWAATIALGMLMFAQVPHAREVFETWAKEGTNGLTFALGFEAAVLMFVVRQMHGASWGFASLSSLINVAYYETQDVNMWAGVTRDNWICWLLALALPFGIAMYSHVLARKEEQAEAMEWPAWALSAWAKARALWVATPVAFALQADLHDVATPAQPATSNMQPAIEDATPTQGDASGDDQPDPKEVAKHLKGEGLKNAQIAARLNVDPSTVGRWLNGANKVAA